MRFGFMEILLVVGVVLLIFGPSRFIMVGKSFRKSIDECKEESNKETKE